MAEKNGARGGPKDQKTKKGPAMIQSQSSPAPERERKAEGKPAAAMRPGNPDPAAGTDIEI